MADPSERLRLVGTREVKLSVFELKLNDEDKQRMADDLVGMVTEILINEGQTVNGVLVANQAMAEEEKATPTDIIFFPPDLGTPIVCHVESPEQFASRWVITGTGA
jgi:hypothetical protein